MTIEIAKGIRTSDIKRFVTSFKSDIVDAEEALCAALGLIQHGGDPDTALFSRIAIVASQADGRLMTWVAPIIAALTELYVDARLIIDELVMSPNTTSRLRAIYALSPHVDDEFVATVVGVLISDPTSSKVRIAAADWIERNAKVQFLPILNAALEAERNVRARTILSRASTLLKHGYVIDRSSETASLTALGTLGSITKILNSADVAGLSDREIFQMQSEELRSSLLTGRLIAK